MRIAVIATSAALAATLAAAAGANEIVATDRAPAAIGPYSQAVLAGDTLYMAGQIAIDPASGELRSGTIEEETQLVLENLQAVLVAAGMSLADVVSTTVFMADLDEFSAMNAVYATYFPEHPPARATVQVARLPRDVKIEISAIAVR